MRGEERSDGCATPVSEWRQSPQILPQSVGGGGGGGGGGDSRGRGEAVGGGGRGGEGEGEGEAGGGGKGPGKGGPGSTEPGDKEGMHGERRERARERGQG